MGSRVPSAGTQPRSADGTSMPAPYLALLADELAARLHQLGDAAELVQAFAHRAAN